MCVHVYPPCYRIHLSCALCRMATMMAGKGELLTALNYGGGGKTKTIQRKRVSTLISTSLRPSICASSKKWGEVYTGESHVGSLPSLVTWILHSTSVSPIDMSTNLPHSDPRRPQSHLAAFKFAGGDGVDVIQKRWEGWARPFIHARSRVNFGTVKALEKFVFR